MEFPPSRHPWSVRIKKPPLAGTGLSWRKQQNFVVLEGVGVCGLAPSPQEAFPDRISYADPCLRHQLFLSAMGHGIRLPSALVSTRDAARWAA